MMKQNKRIARGDGFSFELETKKNLGQNFLADQSILAAIVARAERHADRSARACIEIGPGSGALTRKLLEAGWTVCAIEKDPRAVQGLRHSLGEEFKDRFSVLEADILRTDTDQFAHLKSNTPLCIGNIPYYITSDILFWFLVRQKNFSAALLMVQKEVCERLSSAPGDSSYGRLTVRAQLSCEVEQVLIAPAKAFVPPPKVDSAVVELVPLENPLLLETEIEIFGRFTATLFSARRKMLRKTLSHIANEMHGGKFNDDAAALLERKASEELGVQFTQRPEELSPQKLLSVFRMIKGLL